MGSVCLKKLKTLPMKAALPPSLDMAQATLAGAPPGALIKAQDSAKETPDVSGTKSMSISPNDITNGSAEPVISSSFCHCFCSWIVAK